MSSQIRNSVFGLSEASTMGQSWGSYWNTRKPSSAIASVTGPTTATVTWTDAAQAAQGIKVYVSTDGGVNKTLKATVAFGAQTASITGLTANTYYDFYVVAYSGTHESDAITDFDTTTIDLPATDQIFWYDSVSITQIGDNADVATDKSGQSGNLQAPAEINRPLVVANSLNGYPALSYNGTEHRLVKTDAAERAHPFTVFAVAKFANYNADSGIIGGTTSTFCVPIYFRISSGNKIGIYAGSRVDGNYQELNNAVILKSIVNGASSVFRIGDTEVTGNVGANTLKGLEWGGYANVNGQCCEFLGYEVVGYSGVMSLANQVLISRALGVKYAISKRQVFDNNFHNSVQYGSESIRSPQSEFRFYYTGTTLLIKVNPAVAGIDPDFADIGIFVNGVYNQKLTYAGGSDTGYKEITLPAGKKEVRIVEGFVSVPEFGGTIYGSWITDIIADSSFKKLPITTVSEKFVFLGDSITVGGNADIPCKESFARLFYVDNEKEVTVIGWGYDELMFHASDAGKITATIGYITKAFSNVTGTKKLIIALGTNDYSRGTDAVTFAGWYADLLDAIHLADEDIHIFPVSPIRRNLDPALLASYRTEIEGVCATRDFTTYINGYPFLEPGTADFDDTVHPSTIGHAKIKAGLYPLVSV